MALFAIDDNDQRKHGKGTECIPRQGLPLPEGREVFPQLVPSKAEDK